MRQKKSKTIFYIAGAIVLVGLLFIASRESMVTVEQVEQVLPNDFSK